MVYFFLALIYTIHLHGGWWTLEILTRWKLALSTEPLCSCKLSRKSGNLSYVFIERPITSGRWDDVRRLLFWDPVIQYGPAFLIMTCLKKAESIYTLPFDTASRCSIMMMWFNINEAPEYSSFLHNGGRSPCTDLSHLHTTVDRAQKVQLSRSVLKNWYWCFTGHRRMGALQAFGRSFYET